MSGVCGRCSSASRCKCMARIFKTHLVFGGRVHGASACPRGWDAWGRWSSGRAGPTRRQHGANAGPAHPILMRCQHGASTGPARLYAPMPGGPRGETPAAIHWGARLGPANLRPAPRASAPFGSPGPLGSPSGIYSQIDAAVFSLLPPGPFEIVSLRDFTSPCSVAELLLRAGGSLGGGAKKPASSGVLGPHGEKVQAFFGVYERS